MFKGILSTLNLVTTQLRSSNQQTGSSSSTASAEKSHKKPYLQPAVTQLNFEHGALILLGRAWDGDEQARECLLLLFPAGEQKTKPIAVPRAADVERDRDSQR